MTNGLIKLFFKDGSFYPEDRCVYFKLVKEIYTPYSYFEGVFLSNYDNIEGIKQIQFMYGVDTVFNGLIDSLDFYCENGRNYFKVCSKSFSSLLCQNQTAPGIRTDLTLFDLALEFAKIPNLIYENTAALNYIYVKDGSSMWDAIANFAYKLGGGCPYLHGISTIRVTPHTPTIHRTVNNTNIIRTGTIYDYSKMVSDFHMQDIEGTYNTYNYTTPEAADLYIVRHKHIPLDMQYASNPDDALIYRSKYSKRGFKCTYAEYNGFIGEGLNDYMTIDGLVEKKRIHKLVVTSRGAKVRTFIGTYEDGFLPV